MNISAAFSATSAAAKSKMENFQRPEPCRLDGQKYLFRNVENIRLALPFASSTATFRLIEVVL